MARGLNEAAEALLGMGFADEDEAMVRLCSCRCCAQRLPPPTVHAPQHPAALAAVTPQVQDVGKSELSPSAARCNSSPSRP